MNRTSQYVLFYLGFPILYAIATVAGRATRLTGGEIALVWPAAAVAVIWLLAVRTRSRHERIANVLILAVVTLAANLWTGAPTALSIWFALVNVVLGVVTVGVLTHRRENVGLRDPADLKRLVAAVVVGSGSAAALATLFLTLTTGAAIGETFALFAVRNGATTLVSVAIFLRFAGFVWRMPRIAPAKLVEALLVGAAVGLVFYLIFWWNTGRPTAFLALLPAMWLALRYSTTVSTFFVAWAGVSIVMATLLDKGVFVGAEGPQTRALLAQAMVISLTLVVLALSLYRDSRAGLIAQLEIARDEADRDSELLGAVLDSIHDSVILVDTTGEVVLRNARAADSGLVSDVVSAAGLDGGTGDKTGQVRIDPYDIVVEATNSRVIELTAVPLPTHSQLSVMAFRDVTEQRSTARALREASDLFSGVLQAASEQAIIGTDDSGRITVFNNGAERLLGWTQAEMLGRTPMDFHYRPEVYARAQELGIEMGFEVFIHNVTPEAAEVREWTYVRRDGEHRSVSLAVSQMTAEDGSCNGYIGVATDVTEQRAAEQALAESEEEFRLAFTTAPMGMFMFEAISGHAGRITRCNAALASFLGRGTEEVLGMEVTELGEIVSAAGTSALRALSTLELRGTFDSEVAFRRSDGATVWGAVTASLIAPAGSRPYGICLVEDISSRKRAEAELQHIASHDVLTGLANRALLMERVEHALTDARQHNNSCVGLIFLDLDGFKSVNDNWGHAQGDEVLRTVARRIQSALGPGHTAARLGGDEFAVLCPFVGDVGQLQSLAERIRSEVDKPVDLIAGGTYDRLSVSAGVVTSHPECTAELLLERADRLMYQAKRSGRHRRLDRQIPGDTVTLPAMQLITDLEKAVDLDEFTVYFQPIVDLKTGAYVAAEALLRWQHPKWGLLTPDQFLGVAEASRHMCAIGRAVLIEACEHAQRWVGAMATSAVHVNVSGRQLEERDFGADVFEVLAQTGLDPRRLVLELTETYAGLVADSAKADLERLRRNGVRIAIDDVGTGFSGLARIVDLPVDILKIDKQFIAGLRKDIRCEAITKAILSMGAALEIAVIAEGIESQEQCARVMDFGGSLGQGHLFATPMTGGALGLAQQQACSESR